MSNNVWKQQRPMISHDATSWLGSSSAGFFSAHSRNCFQQKVQQGHSPTLAGIAGCWLRAYLLLLWFFHLAILASVHGHLRQQSISHKWKLQGQMFPALCLFIALNTKWHDRPRDTSGLFQHSVSGGCKLHGSRDFIIPLSDPWHLKLCPTQKAAPWVIIELVIRLNFLLLYSLGPANTVFSEHCHHLSEVCHHLSQRRLNL